MTITARDIVKDIRAIGANSADPQLRTHVEALASRIALWSQTRDDALLSDQFDLFTLIRGMADDRLMNQQAHQALRERNIAMQHELDALRATVTEQARVLAYVTQYIQVPKAGADGDVGPPS